MRLIFVRHGEPNYDLDCLTELGHKQAKIAAKRLMNEGIEKIFSSPLGRAYQTAQAFSEASGLKQIEIVDFMKEIRYGLEDALYMDDKYNPWEIANQAMGEGVNLQDPNWEAFPDFKENTATIDVKKIMAESDKWLESLGYKREGLYYRNICKNDENHTYALFCHGGSSTAFLSRVLNIPFPHLCALLHFPFTGITTLRFDRKPGSLAAPALEIVSDGRHLIQ